ncbi:monoacylglycerol lipase ABHD6-like [Denticeps clupeoides]|nr:monoacylglycerol lipase ABHD6-like [Denticeps clupeoides]
MLRCGYCIIYKNRIGNGQVATWQLANRFISVSRLSFSTTQLFMTMDMVNLFAISVGTLAIPLLAFMVSFLLWPSTLIKVYYWYWRRTLGMQVRHADCGAYRFCYSYRGKPGLRPSILMLHGFSGHKDAWLSVVKFLPKHLHILCVDMPGHEGTTRSSADDYSIQGQVQRVHQFVECIKLNKKPFHIVGTSMGGNVAGVYAATYPSDIFGVTLICPSGIKHTSETKFDNQLQDLLNSQHTLSIPLIPNTAEEMEEMLRLCSHVRFKVPQQVLQGLVDVRIPHNDFYQEVFMKIWGESSRFALHEHMHQITSPLQVIWGKQDQVVDVSGARVIAEVLSGCRLDLLDHCGHSVVMERPRKTAKLILDFIISQQSTQNASNKKQC